MYKNFKIVFALCCCLLSLESLAQNAAFTATSGVCKDDPVSFTDISTPSTGGNIVTWSWDFGDGQGSPVQNPIHTFSTGGNKSVRLTVVDDLGNSDFVVQTVTILAVVAAPNFSVPTGSNCVGTSVTIDNQSSLSIDDFTWDFGDGSGQNSPTNADVIKSYADFGTFDITLTANDNGCSESITKEITINAEPEASFTIPASVCVNEELVPSNTSMIGSGTITYDWDFGDGTSGIVEEEPGHQYVIAASSRTITLSVESDQGCMDDSSQTIVVHPQPVASFDFSGDQCFGNAIDFNNTSTLSSDLTYRWDFGDHTTATTTTVSPSPPDKTYPVAGVYQISLDITSSLHTCNASFDTSLIVYPNPNAAFLLDDICDGGSLAFENNTTIASGTVSYLWDLDALGTSTAFEPSLAPITTPGDYDIGLKVTADANMSCFDSTGFTITVFDASVGGTTAGATTVCADETGVNQVTVSGQQGNIVRWESAQNSNGPWSGIASTGTSLNYSGLTNTTFFRAVAQHGVCPEANSSIIQVTIDEQSDAGEIINVDGEICVNTRGELSLSGYTGVIQGWRFRDDPADPWQNIPSSAIEDYTTDPLSNDRYYSALVRNGVCPVVSTDEELLEVSTASIGGMAIGEDTVCQGDNTGTVSLTGQTGQVVRWEASETGNAPWQSIANTTTAVAYVDLERTTHYRGIVMNGACAETPSASVEVFVDPETEGGNITGTDNVCAGDNNGTLTLINHVGDVVRWERRALGDVSWTPIANTTEVHTFSDLLLTTSYRVLVQSGTCTAVYSEEFIVNINPLPSANFAYDEVCEDSLTVFTNISSVATGNLTGFRWTFETGIVSIAESPTYLFSGDGTFPVELIVTSDQGCVDTLMSNVVVNPLPSASFTWSPTCDREEMNFDASSSTGAISRYGWDFGDGAGTSNLVAPGYTYGNAGSYDVILALESSDGCRDTLTQKADVVPRANVSFDIEDVCDGDEVSLASNSTLSGGGLMQFMWDFDDSTTGTGENVTHTYGNSGSFDIKLVVTTEVGTCQDSLTQTITVHPEPVIDFSTSNVCFRDSLVLQNTSSISSGSLTYYWDFGDNSFDTTVTASSPLLPKYYDTDGSYLVKLRGESLEKCSAEHEQQIIIYPLPNADFQLSPICEGVFIPIENNSTISSSEISYDWDFGDFSGTSTDVEPNYAYTDSGRFTVRLAVNSEFSCTDTAYREALIYPSTEPGFVFGTDTLCADDEMVRTLVLRDFIGDIIQWERSPNGEAPWTTIANTDSILEYQQETQSYWYRVLVKSGNCNAHYSDTAVVTIDALSDGGDVLGSTEVCDIGNTGELVLDGYLGEILYWYRDVAGIESVINTQNDSLPFTNLFATTDYRAVVKNGVCEQDTSALAKITVFPETVPGILAANNQVCIGDHSDTIRLSANTGAVLRWESSPTGLNPWTFINNTTAEQIYTDLLATSNFRAIVKSGVCPTDTSNTVNVQVDELTKGGVILGVTEVCDSINSEILTLTEELGDIVRWEFLDVDNPTWTDLSFLGQAYTITNLRQTTSYRVLVKNGVCDSAYSLIHTVTVNPLPVVDFTYQAVCEDSATVFTNTSMISTGEFADFYWQLENGIVSVSSDPVYEFSQDGSYPVQLTVTSDKGCVDSVINNVIVHPLPTAAFTVNNVCDRESMVFTNLSVGALSESRWHFGDGTDSLVTDPNYLYNDAGTYTVALQVTTNFFCKDEIQQEVNVYHRAVPAFEVDSVCLGEDINIRNQTSIEEGNLSYQWFFGDGSTDAVENPNYIYADSGAYNIRLVATTNVGNCVDEVIQTTVIHPVPQVSFITGDECYLDTVTIENTSTIAKGEISYFWDYGDDTRDTTTELTTDDLKKVYEADGNYSISLIGKSAFGCTGQYEQSIDIHPLPVADFEIAPICEDTDLIFTNTSSITSGGNTYQWDFGDGLGMSADESPVYQYLDSGVYQAQLVVTSNKNCLDSVTMDVLVYPQTMPGTILGTDTLCFDDEADYALTLTGSVGDILRWERSFTGGEPWISLPATDTVLDYRSQGQTAWYRTFVQSGNCSLEVSDTAKVTIDASTEGGIVLGSARVCDDENQGSVTLSSFTGDILSWFSISESTGLIVPINNQSPQVDYANLLDTTYYQAVVKNGVCPMDTSAAAKITVYPDTDPGLLVGIDTVCKGGNEGLLEITSETGSVNRWESSFTGLAPWVTIENMTDSLIFEDLLETTFYRSFVQSGVCEERVTNTIQISVDENTVAGNLTGTTKVCEILNDGLISIEGHVGDLTRWELSEDDGVTWVEQTETLESIAYQNISADRRYRASVKSGVCPEETTPSILVETVSLPDVVFTATEICDGEKTNFVNGSSHSDGEELSFRWDFGGGNLSFARVPSYTFEEFGTYDVKLRAESEFGCVDSTSVAVIVNPNPVPAFTFEDQCLDTAVVFTNGSQVALGAIATYIWDFGDESGISNETSPTHLYDIPDSYTVKLSLISDKFCTAELEDEVTIYPKAVPSFVKEDVCFGQEVKFENNSEVSTGNMRFRWNFGDTQTSSEISPTHFYADSGAYIAALTVITDFGCTDLLTQTVSIFEQPIVDYSFEDKCLNEPVVFTNQTIYTGDDLDYLWNLGDGKASVVPDFEHQYLIPGIYQVGLRVTSSNGCTDYIEKDVTIKAIPVPSFTFQSVCEDLPVDFVNQSSIAEGNITYRWDFGDGTESSDKDPTHQYPSEGDYPVTLFVTSDFGCIDSLTRGVDIFPLPETDFMAASVCDGEQTIFLNNTLIPTGEVIAYNWNLGDNTPPTTLEEPIHLYLNHGVYPVTLLAISDRGCRLSVTKDVEVWEFPVANFSFENVCHGDVVEIINTSFISEAGGALSHLFDLGDGSPLQISANPIYEYEEPGEYTISLNTTTIHGCEDSVAKSITIYELPTVVASNDTVTSRGFGVEIQASGAEFYTWSPTISLSNSTIANPIATPLDTTTFIVVGEDEFGCQSSDSLVVNVRQDSKVIASNILTPDDNGINDAWVVTNIETFGDAQVTVYDRWGKVVFEDRNYQNDWTGVSNGDILPDGTYYYTISFAETNTLYKGAITIIRNR